MCCIIVQALSLTQLIYWYSGTAAGKVQVRALLSSTPDSLQVTEKADIYSFGVVLHEIVTGDRPQRGFLRTIQSPEDAPADVAALTVSCMHHDPVQRPSAKTVREALAPHVIKPRSARSKHSRESQSS